MYHVSLDVVVKGGYVVLKFGGVARSTPFVVECRTIIHFNLAFVECPAEQSLKNGISEGFLM